MVKRIFNKEEMEELQRNQNVAKCERVISYREEFKIMAIRKYRTGLTPFEIFRQAGFDIEAIGREVPGDCLYRWRKIFEKKGEKGLRKVKSANRGRIPKSLTDKEKLKRLKAEVAYLREENHFLAELRKKSLN